MLLWVYRMAAKEFLSPFKIIEASKLKLPRGRWCVLYDKKLKKHLAKISGDIVFNLPVVAGEAVKSLKAFEKITQQLNSLENSKGKIEGICVLGGGSLGDVGAFVASVYRRGLRLVIMPSTYLSVIDSAFGGKTAINFAGAKNQIGSFYPAEGVFIHKKVLPNDPVLIRDAFAEILKMAILEGGVWKLLSRQKKMNAKTFWKLAAPTIRAKLKIVKADPREKLGLRQKLNLGHTLGHVFEKLAPLSHGEAVALGLFYELEIFYLSGKLDEEVYLDILDVWEKIFDFKTLRRKLGKGHSEKKALELLIKDKKAKADIVLCPVVYGIGKIKVEALPVAALLRFLKIQGITR